MSCSLVFEILSGCGISAREDPAGVIETHRQDRVHKDLPGGGCGSFGGSIHAENESVHIRTISNHPKASLQRPEIAWHQNFDRGITEITIGLSGDLHCVRYTNL